MTHEQIEDFVEVVYDRFRTHYVSVAGYLSTTVLTILVYGIALAAAEERRWSGSAADLTDAAKRALGYVRVRVKA